MRDTKKKGHVEVGIEGTNVEKESRGERERKRERERERERESMPMTHALCPMGPPVAINYLRLQRFG